MSIDGAQMLSVAFLKNASVLKILDKYQNVKIDC